jgi:uridine kinase
MTTEYSPNNYLQQESDSTDQEDYKIPEQILFDENAFSLILKIDNDAVDLDFINDFSKANELELKNEFHITVLGLKNGGEIRKTLESLSNKERQKMFSEIRFLVDSTDWHFVFDQDRYFVSKKYENVADPEGSETTVGEERVSCIQMVILPGMNQFYKKLNTLLGTNLEAPPPHITLCAKSSDSNNMQRGIGIYSQNEFVGLNPERIGGKPTEHYQSIDNAVAELSNEIIAWELNNPTQRCFIIIAGPTGSGKDKMVDQLNFAEDATTHLSLDCYYRGAELQQREDGEVNFSVPKALDQARILSDLEALLKAQEGEEIMAPVYDMKTSRRVGQEPVRVKRRIIITGVYALNLLSQINTPFKWYMDASEATILGRKLVRDTTKRGIPDDVVRQRFEQNVKPALGLVAKQKILARAIINNN